MSDSASSELARISLLNKSSLLDLAHYATHKNTVQHVINKCTLGDESSSS